MDMFPEKELEPSEPSDEESEAKPTEAPEGPSSSQPEANEEAGGAPEPELSAQTPSEPQPSPRQHPSFDEALGEMRQSLREEETKEKTGFGAGVRRWVQRVFRRKTAPLPEVTEARLDEFAIPEAPPATTAAPDAQVVPEQPLVEEAGQEAPESIEEPERPPSEASTFHKMVQNKLTGALPGLENIEPVEAPHEAATEDAALDFLAPGQTHLKQEPEPEVGAASGQSILTTIRGEEQEEAQENVSNIREAALEDYETAPADEEVAEAAPLQRRLRRGWRDMRPIDRTMLTGVLALLGVVVIGLSGYAIAQATGIIGGTPPAPSATPTASITPIPISLSLPGGWVFPLKTGRVDPDGVWRPQGAEWLINTEVCRWVSLPHTVQLEAVIRTLKGDDPIQLSMSNYDSIIYKVQSIQQVAPDKIQDLAKNTPCLLVILSKEDSPTRWVVTAKP